MSQQRKERTAQGANGARSETSRDPNTSSVESSKHVLLWGWSLVSNTLFTRRSPAEIRGSFLMRLGVEPSPQMYGGFGATGRSAVTKSPALISDRMLARMGQKGVKGGGKGGGKGGKGKDGGEFKSMARANSLSPRLELDRSGVGVGVGGGGGRGGVRGEKGKKGKKGKKGGGGRRGGKGPS